MESHQPPEPLGRKTTGIPGLDKLLDGGIVAGAVYIVQGPPGAGKTILANQFCFHRAAEGERCLYLTLLSESHDRLLRHMGQMQFFDATRIPEMIYYASGFGALEREGLAGVLRLVSLERRRRDASVVVLDGLFVLEEHAGCERDFRRFVHDLATLAHLSNCTILLLTNSKRGAGSAEYTMVDGWLELGREQLAYRALRYVQVHKTRGSDFLSGRHVLKISNGGLAVYPRLESELHPVRTPPRDQGQRLSSGMAKLDEILGGGLRAGSTTLVVGPTGIGKTSLGLKFLSRCTPEEPGVLFGFYEDESDLIEKARGNGLDLHAMMASGAVTVVVHPAVEYFLDELGQTLLQAVQRSGAQRLFVDGVEAFEQSAEHPERLGRYLTAMANILRAAGVTTLYTMEIPKLIGGEVHVEFGPVSAVSQNILVLRYVELKGCMRRALSIMKARQGAFDATIRELVFTEEGLDIGEQFEGVDDILAGHGHPRPPGRG
ncbi:AAA family ATPase [Ectothiorhodospiraceae bacterium 2226]|nr:AAA family ATPase [Ectothiorhodospiraceae bacterium 2226]